MEILRANTDKFEFTIGVAEGYSHNNETSNIDFAEIVDECSRETEALMGIYISFNIMPIVTLYKAEWGCPKGGEKTYALSAIRNPKFNSEKKLWENACLNVMSRLKYKLKQSTVTGEFSEVQIVYCS